MATMADKRDYYEVLGVDRSASKEPDRRGLSQAGLEVSPGPQSGRRGGDRQVQGGGRGLRGAQPSGEAGELRPLRPRRAGGRRRPALPRRGRHLRGLRRHLRRRALRRSLRRRRRRPPRPQGRRRALRSHAGPAWRPPTAPPRSSSSNAMQTCDTCGGSGAKPGTRPEGCPYCGGHGRGRAVQRHLLPANHLPFLPRQRQGDPRSPAQSCRGSGFVLRRVSRKVDIPAGVDNGTQLRLSRRGRAEPGRRPARRLLLRHPRQGASALPSRRPPT